MILFRDKRKFRPVVFWSGDNIFITCALLKIQTYKYDVNKILPANYKNNKTYKN